MAIINEGGRNISPADFVARTVELTTRSNTRPMPNADEIAKWQQAYCPADAGSLGSTSAGTSDNNPITLDNSQWKSSHNSFQRNETIFEQWNDWGVYSFELDIHAGDPPVQWPLPDNRPERDWYVYHNTWDQDTHYTFLTDGLEDVQRINEMDPNHPVITLFIDLKGDVFQSGQTMDDFDDLLVEELGPSLYTPQDFVSRCGDATTLHEAIEQNGWPSMDELRGKVIVVLTGGSADGQLGEYTGDAVDATGRAAFIAPDAVIRELNGPPNGTTTTTIRVAGANIDTELTTFYPDPNAIFYNMRADGIRHADLITEQNFMLRVWDLNNESSFTAAQEVGANYLGTNKVNTDRDDWSTTHRGDTPFTTLGTQ